MIYVYLLLAFIIILLLVLLLVNLRNQKPQEESHAWKELNYVLQNLEQKINNNDLGLKHEFASNRKETAENAQALRTELNNQLDKFIQTFSGQLTRLTASNEEKLLLFQEDIRKGNKDSRAEQKENLQAFQQNLNEALKDYRERLREMFTEFGRQQQLQHEGITVKLADSRTTVENAVKSLQESNVAKLEEMRQTVDEKLQKTLETRLAQSFTLVSERLETVHKGLGEMQQLAIGVGDLKKVLSNVKTRGMLGEIQLSNILEQVFAPEQYEINVITKSGTANRVEFAIKIPQQQQGNKILLMPVDSKFPMEDYYNLVAAYDAGDTAAADAAGKALENAIKKAAKDIHEKYIDPPATTEIGLLFLPVEGLYAEAVRRPALMETLQREYQIILTGPTTLSAILNTISFGYKTMALEQRSGEIKKVLQAVKTEFRMFSDVLTAAQKKIINAHDDIDKLVGTRTRQIQRKLKDLEELPAADAELLLGDGSEDAG